MGQSLGLWGCRCRTLTSAFQVLAVSEEPQMFEVRRLQRGSPSFWELLKGLLGTQASWATWARGLGFLSGEDMGEPELLT